jgi:iron(III) transport system substrate-binding protein
MRRRTPSITRALLAVLAVALVAASCGDDGDDTAEGDVGGSLTVYSGRSEELVADLIERFEEETGVDVSVRYASSPELAATIREEGSNSPADVFFAVDPGSLGAVAEAGLLSELPVSILDVTPEVFSDAEGEWVGTSGRARVLVYDATEVDPAELPEDVYGLTDETWRGEVGIAPSNGSFLSFVAAMILIDGEDSTREWLEGMAANDAGRYAKNSVIVAAVDAGEVATGLSNHYYLLRLQDEVGETNATNHFFANGGPGALVMPAGAGILETTDNPAAAEAFVTFLLSEAAQDYFVTETFEYPMRSGIEPNAALPAIDTLNPPDIDLSELATVLDLATDLVAEAGLL